MSSTLQVGGLVVNSAGLATAISATIVVADAVTAYPGPTNTGYKNAPGYPGALKPGPTSFTANTTYSFMTFPTNITVSVSGVKFIGCCFNSNYVGGWNVQSDADVEFHYCTFKPTGLTSPPNAAWPSAGAGLNASGGSVAGYMTPYNSSYQYGVWKTGGTLLMQNCDLWGFGNAVVLTSGTSQKTIQGCWIHDAADAGPGTAYHQDGPGYLDGVSCSNVSIDNCTIASFGNTNGIAFQAGVYHNISVTNCYLSGFGYCVDMCHATPTNTNLTFTDNVIATDMGWDWGPIYADFSANFSKAGSTWARNKLHVAPGNAPRRGFASGDDGKFIWPDASLNTTDWP